MDKQKQERIQVAKAALPLAPNQALNDFMGELREGVKARLGEALGVVWEYTDDRSASMYTKDVFADHVVAEVDQWVKGKGRTCTYWMVPYNRGPSGLVYGDPVEVVKEIRYIPKAPIAKRAPGMWSDVL